MDFAAIREKLIDAFKSTISNSTPLGSVVTPRGMTVFGKDDPREEDLFVASGRICITLVTPECLLLVLSDGEELRVMNLDSGNIGRVSRSSVDVFR